MNRSLAETRQRLAVPPGPGAFSDRELEGLPSAACRLLSTAIVAGTPAAAAARLRMRGSIKLGRWLPFRAEQVIAPGAGLVWSARVAGVIEGYDRYVDGRGDMRWKLAHLLTVARASGPDVDRSAAGRAAGEAFWVPTALLPRFGVEWCDDRASCATARVPTAAGPVEVHYELDGSGHIRSVVFERWGDPDGTGRWDLHPFGGIVTEHRTFGGVTAPTRGTVGWHFGTDRWPSGAFFRFHITDLRLVL